MKKIIVVIVGIVMMVALVGCGGDRDNTIAVSSVEPEPTPTKVQTHFVLKDIEFDIKGNWVVSDFEPSIEHDDKRQGYTITLPSGYTLDATYSPKEREFSEFNVPSDQLFKTADNAISFKGHSGWELITTFIADGTSVKTDRIQIEHNGDVYGFTSGYVIQSDKVDPREELDALLDTVVFSNEQNGCGNIEDVDNQSSTLTGVVSNVANDVNVRSAPSTDASVLGKAHLGEAFHVLTKDYTDGWHEIDFNGTKGYISSDYIVIGSDSAAGQAAAAANEQNATGKSYTSAGVGNGSNPTQAVSAAPSQQAQA